MRDGPTDDRLVACVYDRDGGTDSSRDGEDDEQDGAVERNLGVRTSGMVDGQRTHHEYAEGSNDDYGCKDVTNDGQSGREASTRGGRRCAFDVLVGQLNMFVLVRRVRHGEAESASRRMRASD